MTHAFRTPRVIAGSLFATLAMGGATLPALAQTPTPTPVEKVTVRAVAHFDFDAATLSEADRQALLAEVGQMSNVTWQVVTATGHTDSVGTTEYNQKLAARRADAVRGYLLSKGLDPAMVRSAAQGETAPVADNNDPSGRARNRRTEVRFEGVRTASK
jgi:OmpA-OmpF porin, OOP family